MSEITTYDCETLAYEVREMTTEEHDAHLEIIATMEKFADEDAK
jgi:hypothetical protein